MKKLPFIIERDGRLNLTEQLIAGITRGIRSGYYAPGDQIPTILEMANALGVSTIVIRNAMKRLAAAGSITARPKTGIRIKGAATGPWKAHVLLLARARSVSFYFALRNRTFQDRLAKSQVRTSVVLVGDEEYRSGFAGIESVAEMDPVDLTILEGPSWGVVSVLEQLKMPFIHAFAPKPSAKAVGIFVQETEPGLRALVRHLAACGAERVLGVFVRDGDAGAQFEDAVCVAGMGCEILSAEAPTNLPNPENVETAGLLAVQEYLKREPRLPDVIYFSDDYLGRGGLMALASAGKRIPEDVQVVTCANRGNRVAFPKPLTRMEADPAEIGETLAKLVLDALDKPGGRKWACIMSPRLVVGETTVPKGIR